LAEHFVAAPATFAREGDKRLFMELRRVLWDYEPLRSTRPQVDLDVTHGTVRLTGRVRTLAMKEIVGYLVRRTEGVGVVRNDLISDTEVVQQVADVLARDAELGPLCIRVDVRDGVATLTGELPDAALEERAVLAARQAPGAADVVSELSVRRFERPPTAPRPGAEPAVMASDKTGS
jgi:osmotically-inducible protein OsmY